MTHSAVESLHFPGNFLTISKYGYDAVVCIAVDDPYGGDDEEFVHASIDVDLNQFVAALQRIGVIK